MEYKVVTEISESIYISVQNKPILQSLWDKIQMLRILSVKPVISLIFRDSPFYLPSSLPIDFVTMGGEAFFFLHGNLSVYRIFFFLRFGKCQSIKASSRCSFIEWWLVDETQNPVFQALLYSSISLFFVHNFSLIFGGLFQY